MDEIKALIRNPKIGLSNITELHRKAKIQNKDITKKQIKDALAKNYSSQIHSRVPKINHYYPITSSQQNDVIQIDLMDISNVSSTNNNYKWLMVCQDVFTRKGYIQKIKNKTTSSVVSAFEKY